MKFEDFLQEFNELHICKVDPRHSYNVIDVRFPRRGRVFQSFISINVTKAGKYTFSADRKDRHYYREIITLLSLNRVTIGKVTDNGIEFVKAECDCFRNTYIRVNITPGKYIALVEIEYSEKTRVSLDRQKETKYQTWRDIMFSCYGPTICDLQQLDSQYLNQICSQSFNKLQFQLIKDMFLHKPSDFQKYGVEKLGRNMFHIKMKDGSVKNVHFEQYQLLDLMVVVLSNNNPDGMRFTQKIKQIKGYELISDQGLVIQGGSNNLEIASGGQEIFLLRFIDGKKEYFPDFM